jgi:nucleoside-diphosphate-sugar epimerase
VQADSLRVMVTGSTGMTGSHTVRMLLDAGHDVRALVRNPSKAIRVFGKGHSSLQLVKGDITDRHSVLDALHECDAVIHCAAVVAVGTADGSEDLLETNVAGVKNVIGSAIERGIERIVHLSSVATLFRGDGTTLDEQSEPQDSQHAYGRSKAIAERYVRKQQVDGHPVKIVYPSAIIGPDDPGLSEAMVALKTFVDTFIPITSAGMQFVDARDLAHAHLRIVEATPGPGRYLVAGAFLSWRELASIIASVSGRRPRAWPVPPSVIRGLGHFLDAVRKVFPVEFPLTAEAAAYVTRWDPVPSSPSLGPMGVTFRDVQDSLRDAIAWLEREGHLD